MTQKVLIIGLDGATWDIIKPLADEGKLPTFKKLMDNGVWGNLESTIPPVTGAAWLSLATGKNPGKTGIIDFLNRKDKSYKLYSVNSSDFKGKSFWDHLSMCNIKAGIFNYPMLYPPYNINGFMISGIGAPSSCNEIAYPPELKEEIDKIANKYEIYVEYHDPKYEDLDLFLNDIDHLLDKHEKVIYTLLKKEWDFLFVVFSVTDWIQHIMWRHIDENHPLYDPKISPKYFKEFIKFWQRIDKIIKKILKMIDETTIIFFVSDHGFGSNTSTFNLIKWLELKKYLFKKNKIKNGLKENISQLIHKIVPKSVLSLIPLEIQKKVRASLNVNVKKEIEMEKNYAYCLGHTIPFGAIYINENVEKDKIKRKLISDLKNMSKDIGKNVDVKIFEKEKIYHGEKIDFLPDIIFTINNWACTIVEDNFNRPLFEEKPYSSRHTGSHRLNGIFLAYGPGIKKGYKIKSAKIYDIAPTILHIFGLPIPNDVDGKVLVDIFEKNSEFVKREPKYVEPEYYEKKVNHGEKEKIKKIVKSLGRDKKL